MHKTAVNDLQAAGSNVLPRLLRLTDENCAEAASLQHEPEDFAKKLSKTLNVEEGADPPSPGPGHPDSCAARTEAHEKRKHVSPVDNGPQPDFPKQE
ncbi:uncharacterized protein BXZ73DRAFT_105857 [Epithele typhae]|uniref:uncharacterized protein n=1 Tax=Epithele typhae TaxID=378194 RepID=UPI002007639E|nr:uncharacterized protein BXZ73DRAFT_105857 [Epithele typhae]KAH9916420.1 hypothetical protein BXZ73DRAFT_105857 [Epithele typhae]